MLRNTWKAIAALVAGALLALTAGVPPEPPAEARDVRGPQAELVDRLLADELTREEMVGLYSSLADALFQPPPCMPGQEMFDDVPATHPFCAWIEELARRGITTGCTPTQYCPGNPVTRAQMAIFLVRSIEACPTLDPTDEMVRVGGVCIDRYEASIWDAPVGGNQNTGAIPCNGNGQDCDNIYARSVAGVLPQSGITWFQAQAALANSGKRLPTNAEWQMAVAGTPDGPSCNVDPVGSTVPTGSLSGCVSRWGTFDMVGNVSEWVADWVPRSTTCGAWPSSAYGNDMQCLAGASTTGEPGTLWRGGAWANGVSAGPFAVNATQPPTFAGSHGFRGAR